MLHCCTDCRSPQSTFMICDIGLYKYNPLDLRLNYAVSHSQLRWASVAGCRQLPGDPQAPVWSQQGDLWPQRVVLCQSARLLPALQQISLGPLAQIQPPLAELVFPHFLLVCILFCTTWTHTIKTSSLFRRKTLKYLTQGDITVKTKDKISGLKIDLKCSLLKLHLKYRILTEYNTVCSLSAVHTIKFHFLLKG